MTPERTRSRMFHPVFYCPTIQHPVVGGKGSLQEQVYNSKADGVQVLQSYDAVAIWIRYRLRYTHAFPYEEATVNRHIPHREGSFRGRCAYKTWDALQNHHPVLSIREAGRGAQVARTRTCLEFQPTKNRRGCYAVGGRGRPIRGDRVLGVADLRSPTRLGAGWH